MVFLSWLSTAETKGGVSAAVCRVSFPPQHLHNEQRRLPPAAVHTSGALRSTSGQGSNLATRLSSGRGHLHLLAAALRWLLLAAAALTQLDRRT